MDAVHDMRLSPVAVCSLPCFLLSHVREDRMNRPGKLHLMDELLGSAHVFVSAVNGVMEQKLLTAVAGSDITQSQLKILQLLVLTGAHNIGDVAAFLGVSDAAASKSVDRLVRRKFVRRTAGRADRRSYELSLAAAGRRVLAEYEAAKHKKLAEVFAGLDPEEMRRTAEFLELLTRGIVNGSANPEEVCLQCGIHLKTRCLVRDAALTDCSFQRHANRRLKRSHVTQAEIPARGGRGVGPPRQ